MKLFGLRNFIKDKCLISLKVLEMLGICLAFLVPQGLTATYEGLEPKTGVYIYELGIELGVIL